MSKTLKLSIVLSITWLLVSLAVLFNIIYIYSPEMGSDFWLVFLRSVTFVSVLPLLLSWGVWWIFKTK